MNARLFSRQAFTLIELLVVITIIAVLAGLLLPVTGKVMESARKTSAKNTETQIVAAVNSYFTDYGAYPVPPTAPAGDYTYDVAGGNRNSDLFGVLRATNIPTTTDNRNARRIVYFEYKNVKNSNTPKDGFAVTDGKTGNTTAKTPVSLNTGDLADPWGNLYAVRIDSGYTNAVVNPYGTGGDSATANDTVNADGTTIPAVGNLVRTGVVAYSYGSDGAKSNGGTTQLDSSNNIAGLQGDDVISWQ